MGALSMAIMVWISSILMLMTSALMLLKHTESGRSDHRPKSEALSRRCQDLRLICYSRSIPQIGVCGKKLADLEMD
jgi:hypothetical protein